MGYFNKNSNISKSYNFPKYDELVEKMNNLTHCPISGYPLIPFDANPSAEGFEYKVPQIFGEKIICISGIVLSEFFEELENSKNKQRMVQVIKERDTDFIPIDSGFVQKYC